ncbi:MAG: hypothetical protein ACREOW_18320 [Thermodesulfobacteriota bacterium]
MTENQVIEGVGVINVGITPFAFQFYAKDFYEAYKNHKTDARFSPARLFLLTRSIELAAKALHLKQGRTANDLLHIDHDLEKACDSSILMAYGISLTANEEEELKKANNYYKNKGFEYFLFNLQGVPLDRSGPQQALSGWRDLPDENTLKALLNKLLSPKL